MNSSLAILAVLVPLTAAVPGSDLPVPECAWPSQVAADASNVALPDTSARYWVMPYKAYPGRQIVISGSYPDDRYISFAVYDGQAGTFESNGVFSRLAPRSELFPNADSGYLSAWTFPPVGNRVIVVRGRAPSAPAAASPRPWPLPGDDVRYRSLCTNLRRPDYPVVINTLPDGTTDPGCRYDSQVALDDDGHYTFAIGTEAQRAAIEAVPGVTFVPFSLDQLTAQHLLVLRNMPAAPDVAEAIKNVPPTGDPVAAAAVMGDYYPDAEVCDLAVLAAGGC